MAAERLSMRQIREILRLTWKLGKTYREVHDSLRVSVGAIADVLKRAKEADLHWGVNGLDEFSDDELEAKLYKRALPPAAPRPLPDPLYLQNELRRVGVTLKLLHDEYKELQPDGYGYTQFCGHYNAWLDRRSLVMRQVHRAGEKMFVDYSGKKPHYVDPKTAERVYAELFVAVLGASNLTYAEATLTQQGPEWIASHQRTLRYFAGVPAAIVCDQLKSGVAVPCRYDPGIQRTYEDMARHYDTAIVPARPRKPRDKAKVEVGVQIAQRWIMARLRNQTFFSLEELNARIAELLEEMNSREMKGYKASRRELYEKLERAVLKPLPTEPFVYCEWLEARVNIDYHIEVTADHHYYSVHYTLVHEKVDVRLTAMTVEIFRRGVRLQSYARSYVRGGYTTLDEHMPKSHREAKWPPGRLLNWAAEVGPQTSSLARAILEEKKHPEHGYRSVLGMLRLGDRYGKDRLEAACGRALSVGARSYRHVDNILKRGLDRLPAKKKAGEGGTGGSTPVGHENIRGPGYYH